MYVYCLILLVQSVRTVDFNGTGELGIEMKIDSIEDQKHWYPRGKETEEFESWILSLDSKESRSKTRQCLYQMPENKEVNTLLSNMMNVLTKIFTRTRELCKPRAQYRGRAQNARFHVVGAKDTPFFDDIYSNMTQGFRSFYQRASGNATARSAEPCAVERRLWRGLLRRSEAGLRHAAAGLITQQLELTQNSDEMRLRRKLKKLLREEIQRWRPWQLDWICKRSRRCFEELS